MLLEFRVHASATLFEHIFCAARFSELVADTPYQIGGCGDWNWFWCQLSRRYLIVFAVKLEMFVGPSGGH